MEEMGMMLAVILYKEGLFRGMVYTDSGVCDIGGVLCCEDYSHN